MMLIDLLASAKVYFCDSYERIIKINVRYHFNWKI